MKSKGFSRFRSNRWQITEKIFKSLFLTGMIIEFSQVGAGFIDGLITSRFLGPEAMAGEGLAYPIFSILGIISGLLAVGMEIKCAQLIGRGNLKDYSRFVSAAIYAGAIAAAVMTAVTLIFSRPFAVMLGASGNASNLLEPASRYLFGVGIGIPALILLAVIAPALQFEGREKTIQTGSLICIAANIAMDFIAVKAGWGIFGIGFATSVSNYLNLLFQSSFFMKKDRMFHFVRPVISIKDFFLMLANGSEKAVKRLANSFRPVVLNMIIISYGGSAAMSVLSVRNNFSSFAEIFGAGIAAAVSILTGIYYGEINVEGIEEVYSYKHKLIMLWCCGLCVVILIFAKPIAMLYFTKDDEMFGMVVFAVRLLALQTPLRALIECRIKYLQAIHRKINMNAMIVVSNAAYVLLSAFVLGSLFGIAGILACYTVSDALVLITVYIYYAVKMRHRLPSKRDFLNLPDEFFIGPGDVISLDIRNIEDVSLASEQIKLFCKGHKLDEKTAYYSSLSFEELAANIVEHGFPHNKAAHPIIDMRAVLANDSFVIRLRDNCPLYDVTKQIAAVNNENSRPTQNIGIRIVSKMTPDITYMRTLNTNSLILRYAVSKKRHEQKH